MQSLYTILIDIDYIVQICLHTPRGAFYELYIVFFNEIHRFDLFVQKGFTIK